MRNNEDILTDVRKLNPQTAPRDSAYLFATDSYAALDAIPVKNKDILSVITGGGDGLLAFRKNGAKSVMTFDVSENAKIAQEIKLAAMRQCETFNELTDFYKLDKDLEYSAGFNLSDKIASKLSDDAIKWLSSANNDNEQSLFRKKGQYRISENNWYENNFYALKQCSERKADFIKCAIGSLPDVLSGNTYDIIYLSNAPSFYDDMPDMSELNALIPLLNNNGKIFIYFFPYHLQSMYKIDYEKNIIKSYKTLAEWDCEIMNFNPNPYLLKLNQERIGAKTITDDLIQKSIEKLIMLSKKSQKIVHGKQMPVQA